VHEPSAGAGTGQAGCEVGDVPAHLVGVRVAEFVEDP
jgi:hypothetical protein